MYTGWLEQAMQDWLNQQAELPKSITAAVQQPEDKTFRSAIALLSFRYMGSCLDAAQLDSSLDND